MRLHYLVKLKIRTFMKIIMLEKRNSTNYTYLRYRLTEFAEINISDHKLGKHDFNMLAELNKIVFGASPDLRHRQDYRAEAQCTASSTRPSISGAKGRERAFATRDSTLNICLIESLLFLAEC